MHSSDVSKYDLPRVAINFDTVLYVNTKPNIEFIQQLNVLYYLKIVYIVVYSDSSTLGFERVKGICQKHDIPYHQIVMSAYPTADVHIDTPGFFPESLFLDYVLLKYSKDYSYLTNPSNGLDRHSKLNQISRATKEIEGTTQQAIINSRFKVFIPFTGGLDSSTLVWMAYESGYDFTAFYLDMGQDTARKEWETVQRIASEFSFSERLRFLTVPDIKFLEYSHILFNRNTIIILELAQEMKRNNQWGEIWFGVTAGESPVLGGDKSREWLYHINKLLQLLQLPAHVVCPVSAMDKSDEILWLLNHTPELLYLTDSCFDPNVNNCGVCRACFRKFIASIQAYATMHGHTEEYAGYTTESAVEIVLENIFNYSGSVGDYLAQVLPYAQEYFKTMSSSDGLNYYSRYRIDYTHDLLLDVFQEYNLDTE